MNHELLKKSTAVWQSTSFKTTVGLYPQMFNEVSDLLFLKKTVMQPVLYENGEIRFTVSVAFVNEAKSKTAALVE